MNPYDLLHEQLYAEAYGDADVIHDVTYTERTELLRPASSFDHFRADSMDEWLYRFKYVGGKRDKRGKLRVAGTWVPR